MTSPRRRLVIAVAPRLLGDALSRVLGREDLDVVVLGPDEVVDLDPESDEGHFDIALVSSDEPDVPASVVIRLPETPTLGVARVGRESVPVSDLDSLVALVERCAAALDRPVLDNNGV